MDLLTIPSGLLSCLLLIPLRGQEARQKQVVADHRGRWPRKSKQSPTTRKEHNTMAIEGVQLKGSWYEVYGERSKKLKSLSSSSVGDLCGFSNEIIVFRKGSWFEIYDETGKKLKSLSASSVGDFRNVSGRNILFQKGSWIETYDITGKKINTRSA